MLPCAVTLGKSTAYGLDPLHKAATVTIADDEPVPEIVITSPPDLSTVAPGKLVTVKWTITGGPVGTMNRVEWGTVPKNTASDAKAPYQATFTAPKTPGIISFKVHMVTTGGLNCYSDVQQVQVLP